MNKPRQRLLGSVLIATAVLLAGCFDQTAEQLLASAKTQLEKNDKKAAVIQLKNALQKNSSLAEARFLLGRTLLETGDIAGALIELGKARELGYPNEEIAPIVGAALLFKGDIDRLISEYGQTNLVSPQRDSELKASLAAAYGTKGNFLLARNTADAALKSDPSNVSAQLVIVRLLSANKEYDQAMQMLDRTLSVNPKYSSGWQIKGDLLQAMQRSTNEVLAAYGEALKLDKGNMNAYTSIISILVHNKDMDGAQKQLDALRSQYPGNPQTRYLTALVALENNDVKLANEQVQAMLKIAPENSRFLYLAGAVDYKRGAYQQAATNLHKALLASTNPISVRTLLARTYLRLGDTNKALTTLQPLFENKEAGAEVFALAAEANLQAGDTKLAEQFFSKASQLKPGDSSGRALLALARLRSGRGDQGLEELRSISAADAGPTADLAMINAYLSKGDLGKALSAIDVLERKLPNQAMVIALRGRVQMLQGNRDAARKSFEAASKLSLTYMPAAVALAALDVQDKKPELAIQRFEKILAANPNIIEAQMAIIGLRAEAGATNDELITMIEKVVKQQPGEAAPRLALISTRLEARQVKLAVAAAQEGVAAFPDNAVFYDFLGRTQMAAGDINQAAQAFNKMATLQPNSPIPLMRLAELQMSVRDAPAAIIQLRRVLSMQPDYLPAQSILVGLLAGSGKFADAQGIAQQAKTQNLNAYAGWDFEGDIETFQKRPAVASVAYRNSLKLKETSEVAVKLHRLLVGSGRRDEALKFEDSWIASHPKDIAFLFQAGDAALKLADYQHAERRYLELIALRPNDAVALNNVAWLMQRAGKKGALEYAERAIKLTPDATAVIDTMASIQASAGHYDKAIELQKKALALDPEQHGHRFHLAQYFAAAGYKSEARTELKRLAELGQQFPEYADVQKLLATL